MQEGSQDHQQLKDLLLPGQHEGLDAKVHSVPLTSNREPRHSLILICFWPEMFSSSMKNRKYFFKTMAFPRACRSDSPGPQGKHFVTEGPP